MPNHNLDAARQLTDYGFPVTGDLLCPSKCTHHTVEKADPPSEGSGSNERESVPDPAWIETLREIKRMEDEGEIDKVDYDPFKPVYDWAPQRSGHAPTPTKLPPPSGPSLTFAPSERAGWPEIEGAQAKEARRNLPFSLRRRSQRPARHIITK